MRSDFRRFDSCILQGSKHEMIRDKCEIQIDAVPEAVFDLIETMPNKFPVYSIVKQAILFVPAAAELR